jgi:hypothetical protein
LAILGLRLLLVTYRIPTALRCRTTTGIPFVKHAELWSGDGANAYGPPGYPRGPCFGRWRFRAAAVMIPNGSAKGRSMGGASHGSCSAPRLASPGISLP